MNQDDEDRVVRLRPYRTPAAARRLDLAEEPGEALSIQGGEVELVVRPCEIATVGLAFDA